MDALNLPGTLPPAAKSALDITQKLREAGFQALLAGGCVRDLLRGQNPQDYDVATSARPEQIMQLFRRTRHVGAQFGVVLVFTQRRWVEVATFRSDGEYQDGRRPVSVEFAEPREDALRRDFTINGMFLDPQTLELIDYVGGREDLRDRLIRAIGEPQRRFAEDHLRLIRAVRFAARLDYAIEPRTKMAIRENADKLARVAPERVREELEKILTHPTRARAFSLLRETGLLGYLWPAAVWTDETLGRGQKLLEQMADEASFVAAFGALVSQQPQPELERIARHLAFSNQQRESLRWIIAQLPAWSDPARPSLAELKRSMAHPAWASAIELFTAAYRVAGDVRKVDVLIDRARNVRPEALSPEPLVGGQDLLDRGVPAGPIYKQLLDELYEQQLNEEVTSREAALRALDQKLSLGNWGPA